MDQMQMCNYEATKLCNLGRFTCGPDPTRQRRETNADESRPHSDGSREKIGKHRQSMVRSSM